MQARLDKVSIGESEQIDERDFFHRSAIYGEGIDMLREGDGVEYTLRPSREAHLRASLK